MKNNGKVMVLILIILVVLAICIGFIIISDKTHQETLLKEEVKNVLSSDFINQSIDMELKTKGDYAKVEKAIKEYIHEYSNTIKGYSDVYKNDVIINSLTSDNIKNDGPEFKKTRETINKSKTDATNYISRINGLLSKDKMLDKIKENDGIGQKYIDIYSNYMFNNDESMKSLEYAKDKINKSNTLYINKLDNITKVLDLLTNNKGDWNINNGKIEFKTQSILDEYNTLISNVNK